MTVEKSTKKNYQVAQTVFSFVYKSKNVLVEDWRVLGFNGKFRDELYCESSRNASSPVQMVKY